MLRRHERFRAPDRVAAVRAWTSWRDLRTRQFLSPESDSAWKACHRHWEWGVHQEVAQPLPHVRGSRQHRGLASSLRDLQEYIPLGKFIWPIKYFLKKFYFIINKFPPDNVSFVLCYAKEVLNKLIDHYLVRGGITALPTSCCSFHTINNRFTGLVESKPVTQKVSRTGILLITCIIELKRMGKGSANAIFLKFASHKLLKTRWNFISFIDKQSSWRTK